MKLCDWDDIPEFMKCDEVREYYDVLCRKCGQLYIKRLLDFVLSAVLVVILAVPMIVIAVMIKLDSPGKVFFRQERVTTYGRVFKIHKFRTMIENPKQTGSLVTVGGDSRITKVGAKLRNLRLDELPQLFDVIVGDMTFVGTRAEVPKYVEQYTNDMKATLLLPAGITSEASIRFKDEADLLTGVDDVDKAYVEKVLPEKMRYNLNNIRRYSLIRDIMTMVRTVGAVIR